MPNILDVARAAGVSVATVSRVLNGSTAVSPQTAERVNSLITEMGYRPNSLGRNLRRMRTGIVLVLLPSILNTFYSKIVKGIEDKAHEHSYNAIICTSDDDPKRERLFLNMVIDRQADGIICMSLHLKADEVNSFAKRFPLIQCCEYIDGVDSPSITIDNLEAAKEAVNHLIALGHREIGLISCSNSYASTKLREEGYKRALEANGISFKPERIVLGNYSYQSGYKAAMKLYKTGVTAVFAISDNMAIGAARAASALGLRVPDDIAIVGFDDVNFATMFEPALTTIAQPQYEMGKKAMELLLEGIGAKLPDSDKLIMPHKLVIRQSSVKQNKRSVF